MPIYPYRCSNSKCRHVTELWSSFADLPGSVACERCGEYMSKEFVRFLNAYHPTRSGAKP